MKISTSRLKKKTNQTHTLTRARLTLAGEYDEASAIKLGGAFDDACVSSSIQRRDERKNAPWIFEWIFQEEPAADNLNAQLSDFAAAHGFTLPEFSMTDWLIEAVPDIDWLENSYKQFPPFSIGPFFIYGSHYNEAPPAGQIPLQIDAATAFGSGEHGTTKGCILAMLDLKEDGVCPWNVLDMGTGSGILALAAWKLWQTPVLAVDNDAEAVRVAALHQEINGVASGAAAMICAAGEGFAAPVVQEKKPFDLIIANILAGPLCDMALDLAAVSDENGYVILSGILTEQAEKVLQSYEPHGLRLVKRYDIGEWSTLTLQNTAA